MALVTFTQDAWTVHAEAMLYDKRTHYQRPAELQSGIDELDGFQFGYPTAIKLSDHTLLATHWSHENQKCGIRHTRLKIDW